MIPCRLIGESEVYQVSGGKVFCQRKKNRILRCQVVQLRQIAICASSALRPASKGKFGPQVEVSHNVVCGTGVKAGGLQEYKDKQNKAMMKE